MKYVILDLRYKTIFEWKITQTHITDKVGKKLIFR